MRRGKGRKSYNKNRNKGGKRRTKNLNTYYVSRGGIRL